MLLFFFFFLFLSASSLFLLSSATWRRGRDRNPNLPPSPPRLPLIGNLHQLGSLPHRSLQALAKKYGPLMLLHLGSIPTLVVSSAELAQEIMKTHDLSFSSRPSLRVANRLMYNSKDVAFVPYGEYWRQVRSIFVLHLLNPNRVRSYRIVREEEVGSMVAKISGSPGVVNLSDVLVMLTNDITCRVAFGKKYSAGDGKVGGEVGKLLLEFLKLLGAFDVGELIPCLSWVNKINGFDARVEKNFCELDRILETIVEEHLHAMRSEDDYADKEREDFVDVLFSLEKDSTIGISLDRNTIKALILDAFAAGTDTTSTVLEWTMAELIRHPQLMKKAQEEVREIAQGKSMVVEEDIEQMNYLKSVIKEALRLHTPLPLLVPHESVKAIRLRGYNIQAKTRVLINAWAIARDPEVWDMPEEFWPERFLNSSLDYRGRDFEFIPFGAGRRGCPGISFAVKTIEIALANLLYHFDWEMETGKEMDVSEQYALTTGKKSSLVLVVEKHFS